MKHVPNALCFVRIILAAAVIILLYVNPADSNGLAAFCFVIAAATDWLDGYLARRFSLITSFGKIIDPIADKCLVLGSMFALSFFSTLPLIPVCVIALREVFITVWRLRMLGGGRVVPADDLGKIKTFIQMSILTAFLLSLCADRFLLHMPAIRSILSLLIWPAAFFTLYSGFELFLRQETKERLRDFCVKFFSTFGYCGLVPFAPGTAGSIAAWLIALYVGDALFNTAIFICLLIGSLMSAPRARRIFNSKDPKQFVVDEAVGIFAAMLFIKDSIIASIAALLLFRFFDILKPLGIRALDRMKHPSGIVWDDLLAGIYSLIVLQAFCYFFPQIF